MGINFKEGRSKAKKQWLERLRHVADSHGGKCLAYEYFTSNTNLKFECSEGHQWNGRPAHILRGVWCPQCAVRKQHEGQRKPFHIIRKMIEDRGGTVLSIRGEYLGKTTPIRVRCHKGHEFDTNGDRLA